LPVELAGATLDLVLGGEARVGSRLGAEIPLDIEPSVEPGATLGERTSQVGTEIPIEIPLEAALALRAVAFLEDGLVGESGPLAVVGGIDAESVEPAA
jgi:hypothetical protein